jgi:peptidoglycan/LPS O-acetylase OafA/YrhL
MIGLSGKAVAAFVVPGAPLAGYGANWHSVIERSFWAQADLFAFGMVVAVLYVEMADGRLKLPHWWRKAAWLAAAAVFVPCALTMHEAEHSYRLQNTGEALGVALALAAIVLPRPELGPPTRVMRVLESRPLVAVGLASYSLFLWHHPIILWLRDRGYTFDGPTGLAMNLVVVGVIAGTCSAITYHFVERPALRHKKSVSGALSAPPAS